MQKIIVVKSQKQFSSNSDNCLYLAFTACECTCSSSFPCSHVFSKYLVTIACDDLNAIQNKSKKNSYKTSARVTSWPHLEPVSRVVQHTIFLEIPQQRESEDLNNRPLYQGELTTDKKPTVVYSIRDDISDGYSILG